MSASTLILKNSKGWFAAGAEVQQAMTLLSDGAFKLFVYVCLNARRDSATLEISQSDLARALNKSKGSIRSHLREMESCGVCRMRYTNHPFARGVIQISESFWPYQRPCAEAVAQDGSEAFVAQIRKMLQARACVLNTFSAADESIARRWFAHGVPLERIEQAILLACSRKYVSWANNQTHAPIASLAYFEQVLEEIARQEIDPEYWNCLRFRIRRLEERWKQEHSGAQPPPSDGSLLKV
jgi:hypothetical protein